MSPENGGLWSQLQRDPKTIRFKICDRISRNDIALCYLDFRNHSS